MSIIILLMIIVLVAVIALVAGLFVWDHRKDIMDIKDVRKHYHRKDKLLIDYWPIDEIFQQNVTHKNKMDRTIRWVNCDESDLIHQEYLIAEKWMTELRYIGIPVYVRLHNFHIIDPAKLEEPNEMTSSIMYNVYHAQTIKRYISGMTKVGFAPMDVKSLGVLLPVVIGLAIGLMYFIGKM